VNIVRTNVLKKKCAFFIPVDYTLSVHVVQRVQDLHDEARRIVFREAALFN